MHYDNIRQMVKEVARYGVDLRGMVSPETAKELYQAFGVRPPFGGDNVIAALGPIGFGILLQSLGSETIPLVAMALTGLLMGVTTYVGSGTGIIDDELAVVGE